MSQSNPPSSPLSLPPSSFSGFVSPNVQTLLTQPSSPDLAVQDTPRPEPKRSKYEAEEEATSSPKRSKLTPNGMPQNSLALERVLEQEGSHQPTPEDPKTAPNTKAGHPPLSNSRPSRTRKAPKEHWVVDANERKSTTRAAPPKKGSGKVFDPVFITSNSTSRLGKADVYHMLLEDPAWTSLSSEQQSVLMSMLPPGTTNRTNLDRNGNEVDDTESMRPQAFTMSNDCFRTDVAKFKEDLKNGHLAKTWQAAAEQATIERAAGEYDGWKAQEAELWWGQRSKQSNR